MSTHTSTLKQKYVGLDEAATYLGISLPTIRRRIADGTIPAYKVAGSALRVRISDLEKLVQPVRSA